MPNQPALDVSILVVSYNTKALTLEALTSLQAETRNVNYEVIVVDNASTDGSAEALKIHQAVSRLIPLDENIGFGRANNLAAEYASGRYILLLNPDTVVLDGAVDRLVTFADNNKRALIWGGRTLFGDGTLNPTSVWRQMTLWTLLCRITGLSALFPSSDIFNRESFGNWQRDCVREVDTVSGCFFMMPTTVWNALGGFDPIYFMYGEEADLCLRAKRIGATPLMTPDAEIIHYGAASETTRPGKVIKLFTAIATLIDRHWPYPMNIAGQKLLLGWPLSRWLAFEAAGRVMKRKAWQEKAAVWKEIWDARDRWQFGYARKVLTKPERDAKRSLTGPVGGNQTPSVATSLKEAEL